MIDTSGAPLHKRGYRTESNEAPIRETLAAAMVRMSRPREDVLLADPFCGSGTIAIEAAMLADGVAPGLHRTFAGESFAFLPADVWRDAREEAQSRRRESGMRIYGSDIDPACVELSRANAQRAGRRVPHHFRMRRRARLCLARTGRTRHNRHQSALR